MNWIDLQTGYMVEAFRDTEDMERGRRQVRAAGGKVVYAGGRRQVRERDAQWWVLRSLDEPDMFLDYTFPPAGRPCRTARQSLGTAVELLCGERQAQYRLLVVAKL